MPLPPGDPPTTVRRAARAGDKLQQRSAEPTPPVAEATAKSGRSGRAGQAPSERVRRVRHALLAPSPAPPARSIRTAAPAGSVPPATADVLDVGTGTGFLALLPVELGHRVTGSDLSQDMVAVARAKVRRATGGRPRARVPGRRRHRVAAAAGERGRGNQVEADRLGRDAAAPRHLGDAQAAGPTPRTERHQAERGSGRMRPQHRHDREAPEPDRHHPQPSAAATRSATRSSALAPAAPPPALPPRVRRRP
jgi:hypothetical protein